MINNGRQEEMTKKREETARRSGIRLVTHTRINSRKPDYASETVTSAE